MRKALAIVKTEEPKPKPKRERIVLIETAPRDHWFVRTTTLRGKVVWYLRFEVTGLSPRLYGPFKSKGQALFFLDDALDALADFEGEVRDACEKRSIKLRYQKVWPPIIEAPVLVQTSLLSAMVARRARIHAPIKKGR